MDSNIEFNGLRTQILENYRLISPANADTLIIIEYRQKTQEELNDIPYQYAGMLTHHYCALLVTHPSKGNKVLAQGTHVTPEASLRVLLAWTCENVAGVIAAKYK
ncbi:unnamed protein product [Aureobasidium pullulans]|nr:unnamed protein product [Aureobasidium pullulans]